MMKNSKSCPPIISAILIAAFLSFSITLVGQTKENPNFLIIMTDQQAWDAVGYSGYKNSERILLVNEFIQDL